MTINVQVDDATVRAKFNAMPQKLYNNMVKTITQLT